MQISTTDGTRLTTRVAGDPRAPALLLVHGFGGVKEDWADPWDGLAERFRVVAFDHRGHGESDKPADVAAYSLDRMAADTVEVADALGLDSFCLMGTSMGGMVAQRVATAHPHRLSGLVLQCTWPGPPTGLRVEDARRAAGIALAKGLPALLELMEGSDALTTPVEQRMVAERPGYAEYNDSKFLGQAPEMYAAIVVELLEQDDRSEALRVLTCPTLVVCGAQDEFAMVGCERLVEVIPGARLVIVPEAGHNPQLEHPAAWWDAVTPFLEEIGR